MNRLAKFIFAKYGVAKFIAREKRAPYGMLLGMGNVDNVST